MVYRSSLPKIPSTQVRFVRYTPSFEVGTLSMWKKTPGAFWFGGLVYSIGVTTLRASTAVHRLINVTVTRQPRPSVEFLIFSGCLNFVPQGLIVTGRTPSTPLQRHGRYHDCSTTYCNRVNFARYVIATGVGANIWTILRYLLELKTTRNTKKRAKHATPQKYRVYLAATDATLSTHYL